MWIDFIKWRTEFKVDELYEHFEYPELVEVDKLYPKFYHKTDKVITTPFMNISEHMLTL